MYIHVCIYDYTDHDFYYKKTFILTTLTLMYFLVLNSNIQIVFLNHPQFLRKFSNIQL